MKKKIPLFIFSFGKHKGSKLLKEGIKKDSAGEAIEDKTYYELKMDCNGKHVNKINQ